jgi:hydroxymethylpyrimidine pyrophosphatase-like HAD family hydrolase
MASYVIGLAASTGWTEHFIMWELPLSRGLQYQHATICYNGGKTYPSGESIKEEFIDAMRHIEHLQQTWQPPN